MIRQQVCNWGTSELAGEGRGAHTQAQCVQGKCYSERLFLAAVWIFLSSKFHAEFGMDLCLCIDEAKWLRYPLSDAYVDICPPLMNTKAQKVDTRPVCPSLYSAWLWAVDVTQIGQVYLRVGRLSSTENSDSRDGWHPRDQNNHVLHSPSAFS